MNSRTREPGPKDRWPGSTAENTGLCAKDPPARLGQPFFAFSSEVPPTLPTPPGVGRGLPTHRGQGTPEKKGLHGIFAGVPTPPGSRPAPWGDPVTSALEESREPGSGSATSSSRQNVCFRDKHTTRLWPEASSR